MNRVYRGRQWWFSRRSVWLWRFFVGCAGFEHHPTWRRA